MSELFDLTGPLPTGTTVLEASAGTGKTFAIAALAARYIAEGVAGVDDLLLITFSRAATAELRTRVRERLRDTAEALACATRGVRPTEAVAAHLAHADAEEVALRASRLSVAFAHFDRAAIMTTHEFCHGMLAGLGILAPQTPQSTLVEDLRPLADEAAEDVYLRLFADEPHGAPFPFGKQWDADPGAREIAREAVTEVAELAGDGSPGSAGARVAFAQAVRFEVERRKQARRLYSFDDQLSRLDDALGEPATGAQARARLAERFPVVLVDEFQDTDPVQWSVLRRAFSPAATLVLIGDPKQAIYGFRGGDVHTYGLAVRDADATTTLGVNHRSDPEVVEGVGTLFRGVALGEGIVAPPVAARRASRLVGRPGTPWERGVQVRAVEAEQAISAHHARGRVTADLVALVGEVLGPDSPLRRRDTAEGPEALAPREIAVLVRSNDRGAELARALSLAGLPATFTGSNSVFATEAADDWLALLRALDAPRRPYLQRAFLTDFVGASVRDLALADDDQRAAWSLRIHTWARVLERSGVPALFAALDADADFTTRMLARADGERLVTDHRHLAELLHRHQATGNAPRARDLAAWLDAERDGGSTGSDGTRRRDTDADAVQVMTIHRAKGLQWPVVLLPEVGQQREWAEDRGRVLVLPAGEHRILDVAGRRSPARADRWSRWREEEGDEALRALYVGLTRAQSRVVAWWGHHRESAASPLHRLLHAGHDAAAPARPAAAYPTADLPGGGSPRHLAWLAGTQVVAVPASPDAGVPAPRRVEAPRLGVRTFARSIDHQWRRTSYSGLTAAVHDQPTVTDSPLVGDEFDEGVQVEADPAWAQPSPMADLPSGAAFGTLVHAVYEAVDATGEQWRAGLGSAVGDALRRWPLPGVDAGALASALEPSFTTALGPLAVGATLRSFSPADRLAEMDFEFALANPGATLADIAALLAEHVPADDLLAPYARRLAVPGLEEQSLHGFLTGSIDAVLRLDGHAEQEGYLVVDYKTNRLAAPEEPLTLGHYTPHAMAEAMMASHYPLQALLYCVALHRFLRLRQPGYEPERHLAGVAYLFVRGMAGPRTPLVDGHPLGVFSWRPPAALVEAVSRLLAGGAR